MTPIIVQSPGMVRPFEIHHHPTEANCWSCRFPFYAHAPVQFTKHADVIVEGEDGCAVFHSGSLERIFAAIADHISRTEY